MCLRQTSLAHPNWHKKLLLLGCLLGMTNLIQVYFILKALEIYDGFFVFPMTTAGGLLFTTVAAVWLLKERPGRWSYLGITLACIALILLQGG